MLAKDRADQIFVENLPKLSYKQRERHLEFGQLKPVNFFRSYSKVTGSYNHSNASMADIRGVFEYQIQSGTVRHNCLRSGTGTNY